MPAPGFRWPDVHVAMWQPEGGSAAPVVRPRAPEIRTRPAPGDPDDELPKWATAAGFDDGYCHWLVSRARSLCGKRRDATAGLHKSPPCPNGNTPCPACTRAYGGSP